MSIDIAFASGHTEPWLHDLAVGFSWRTDKALYALDFTEQLFIRGDLSSVRVGVESTELAPLVLRAGTYREGSSFGASVHWQDFRFDLAYVLHYTLPDSYYVSLNYQWEESLLDLMVRPLKWLGSLL